MRRNEKLREKLLEAARRREIDVVLVWRLDRWGRSVADLLATLQELEHLGVGFVSLTEALDLTTPAGRAMAGLLAVFAEFEREILRERVRAGLAHARQNGKRLGRPATAALHARQDPEAISCRRQQGRDRPPVADRPHLSPPNSGLTYFREKSGGLTQACRLTGQSFLIFRPPRCSGVVDRRPAGVGQAAGGGDRSCHRRVAVGTFPEGGVWPRVRGGFRGDRRWR